MNSNDQSPGEALNGVAPLPIPTAQRTDIFVVPGVPREGLDAWTKQTGQGDFWSPPSCFIKGKLPASFCGICLFVSGPWGYITQEQWAMIQPFFKRAGRESNVFEYCPRTKNFVRRDLDWCVERISAE